MYDRRLALEFLFNEIITLSHSTFMMREAIEGGGYPLSGLICSLLQRRTLIDKIVGDYTSNSHEFRLNNAGLKLFWRLDREHDLLKIRIGGDQVGDYPRFVATIKHKSEWKNIR